MEKKDQAKKTNSGMTWAQVMMKTTPSSSSSFTKAAAGASSSRTLAPAWPSRTPYKSVPQKLGFGASSSSTVAPAWPSWTPYKSVPQKSGFGASSSSILAPAWPSRTPYKSVPQKLGLGASSGDKERACKQGPVWKVKSHSYHHVEASPVPPVRQVSRFPSLWSPKSACKVTKKN